MQAFDPSAWREQLRRLSERGSQSFPPAPLLVVPLASFAGAFLGCLATLHLSTFGLPPALASAAATLLFCAALIAAPTKNLVPTTFSSSAYGGSFSGMTPIATLSDSVARSGLPVDISFLMLSIFCGLVFFCVCAVEVRTRTVLLRGYGGRFGALAALGSFLFLSLAQLLGADGMPLGVARIEDFDKNAVDSLVIFALCATGMLASLLALRLPRVANSGRAVRIFVSATVAFAGLAALQYVRPGDTCLADAYYAGCFLGNSSPQRLRGSLQPVIAAAVLTVLLVKASAVLPAVGGSLGLAAFLVVAVVDVVSRLFGATGPLQNPEWGVLGRSLLAACVVAGMLLPNEVVRDRLADDTTGSIPKVETPVEAPAERLDPPSWESAVQTAPSSAPEPLKPVAVPWPVIAVPTVTPAPVASPAVRRPASPAHAGVQPLSAEPSPRRIIRSSTTTVAAPTPLPVRRTQSRVVPQPVPRPRAATQQEVESGPEWQPYPSSVPLH